MSLRLMPAKALLWGWTRSAARGVPACGSRVGARPPTVPSVLFSIMVGRRSQARWSHPTDDGPSAFHSSTALPILAQYSPGPQTPRDRKALHVAARVALPPSVRPPWQSDSGPCRFDASLDRRSLG